MSTLQKLHVYKIRQQGFYLNDVFSVYKTPIYDVIIGPPTNINFL
jgi:hypothetical protein